MVNRELYKKMTEQKKKRGENWSTEEKDILRQLIAQSVHIIEDKSTKTSVNILKTKEWKNISNKLNKITGKCRSDGEVKLAWKRMKLTAKSELSAHRREQSKTGGCERSPSPSPEDLEFDFVIEDNDYDSDAVIPVTTPKTRKLFADPISYEKTALMQGISNDSTRHTKSARIVIITDDDVNTSTTTKRKNSFQNGSEEMSRSIITDFRKRQLEMMEVEHKYNIKIANLKIKKLELEIAVLENMKNTSTEE